MADRSLFSAGYSRPDLVESPNRCTKFLTLFRPFIGTVMEQDSEQPISPDQSPSARSAYLLLFAVTPAQIADRSPAL